MKVSFDTELVPVGFHSFKAAEMKQYDHILSTLGNKDVPYIHEDFCQLHADGLAIEFAPRTPFSSAGEFLHMHHTMQEIACAMSGVRGLMGVDWIDITQVKAFTPRNAPYLWKLAHTLGCSEDYDPSGLRVVPMHIKESPIKEVGFHLHLDLHPKFRGASGVLPVVEEFSQLVAPLLPEWTGPRAPWYRAPMVYRHKPYGMEYRSFGASIVNDERRFQSLVGLAFAFVADHFRTHAKEYYV